MEKGAIAFGVLLFLLSLPVMVLTAIADVALYPLRRCRRAYYDNMLAKCFSDLDPQAQEAVRACFGGQQPTYDAVRKFAKEHAFELGTWLKREQIRAALLFVAANPYKDMP